MRQPVDFGTMPLVLLGPVLRRVEPAGATVFLALTSPRKVTLRLYPDGSADHQQLGTAQTVALGGGLHVVAVTSAGAPLDPGRRYRYQVCFGAYVDGGGRAPGGDPVPATAPDHLLRPGIVGATAADAADRLLLPGLDLPSFVTPAPTPAGLRVLHGAGRLPHGAGPDALAAMDAVLTASAGSAPVAADRALQRPQTLVLTGDQLDAADVAEPLLAVIRALLTDPKALRLPVEPLPGTPADAELAVGARAALVAGAAKLDARGAGSHLIGFGEYAAMHLLVFSDAAWPAELPSFEDVFPAERAALGETYQEILDGDLPPGVDRYPPAVRAAAAHLLRYLAERDRLADFRAGLPAVRRLLANTPTYLALGERDVTPGWNATLAQVRRCALPGPAGGSDLGRRVLTNALLAYAVFGGWGNDPAQYAAGPGAALLDAASRWGTSGADPAGAADLLGLPSGAAGTRPAGAVRHHTSVHWPQYLLTVLDTATARAFPGGPDDPAAPLGDPAGLAAQLHAPGDPGREGVTVVVSPPPLLDLPPAVRATPSREQGVRLGPLAAMLAASRAAGAAAGWEAVPTALHTLLGRLVAPGPATPDGTRRRRVVVLSGQGGAGRGTRLRLVAPRPYGLAGLPAATPPYASLDGAVADFAAACLRGETAGSLRVHRAGYGADETDRARSYAGWANAAAAELTVGTMPGPPPAGDPEAGPVADVPWRLRGAPAVAAVGPGRTVTLDPDWRVEAQHLVDAPPADRAAPPPPPAGPADPATAPTPAPPTPAAGLTAVSQAAAVHRSVARDFTGKHVVGAAHFGDLSFTWGAGDRKSAENAYWYRLSDGRTLPLTRLTAALDPGLPAAEAPVRYGGFTLREGDRDGAVPRYAGEDRPGAPAGQVAQLRADLVELGFLLARTGTGDDRDKAGVFGLKTRWAVREFQVHAKGARTARDAGATPVPAVWSDRLTSVEIPVEQRYAGPVHGVADPATAEAIAYWKAARWRCPLVFEVWQTTPGDPPVRTGLYDHRDNVWEYTEIPAQTKGFGVYARDFSRRWPYPAARVGADPDRPDRMHLGRWEKFSDSWTGGVLLPEEGQVWRPDTEVLPEHLLPAPTAGGDGPTLDALAARKRSGDFAAARALSTFKAVRAVAEVEALGYFDVYNGYDPAFLSSGVCHWAVGPTLRQGSTAKLNRHPDEGEFWAYLAYLREVDPAAFELVCGHTGVVPNRRWGVDGAALWKPGERKYAGQPMTATGRSGVLGELDRYVYEYEYFRTWPWVYRMVAAGRAVDGWRRRMWHMARERLRCILNTPWHAPGAAVVVQPVPVDAAHRRPARVGDVFTSEKACAMLLRWHVLSPSDVSGGSDKLGQETAGFAGEVLTDALARAKAASAGLDWSGSPDEWNTGDDADKYEKHLIAALWAIAQAGNDFLRTSVQQVWRWPDWQPTRESGVPNRRFTLPLDVLDAADRELSEKRLSFLFDDSDLPSGGAR